jgi:hypothetical protein
MRAAASPQTRFMEAGLSKLEVVYYLHFGQNELKFMNENNDCVFAKVRATRAPGRCPP